MRYFWVIINTIFWTTTLGAIGILSSIFESKKGKMLGACAQIWAKLILRIGGVSYSVEGLENLDKNKSYVFAGNHASGFDILLAFRFCNLKFSRIRSQARTDSFPPLN